MQVKIGVSPNDVWKCYHFATQMYGKHNNSLIMERTDEQIFRDDLRGKLAEIAVRRYLLSKKYKLSQDIDFEPYPRGKWDKDDIVIKDENDKEYHLSIKASGPKSNYLLIETGRFDPDTGKYSYKNNNNEEIIVNYYAFVRVLMEGEDKEDFSHYKSMHNFLRLNEEEQWVYDKSRKFECTLMGFLSHEQFWDEKKEAPRGIKANKIQFDTIWEGGKVEPDPNFHKDDKKWLQKYNYIYNLKYFKDDTILPLVKK